MKKLKPFLLLAVVAVLSACSSVRVASDYDQSADFTNYKTFAFFKPGIDKAEISDLDKKRILRAIETEMMAKGFVKSDNPSMLVSIFTTLFLFISANNIRGGVRSTKLSVVRYGNVA